VINDDDQAPNIPAAPRGRRWRSCSRRARRETELLGGKLREALTVAASSAIEGHERPWLVDDAANTHLQ
jgi:hypothetical protein